MKERQCKEVQKSWPSIQCEQHVYQFVRNACAEATGRVLDYNITGVLSRKEADKVRMYQMRRALLVVEGQENANCRRDQSEQNDNCAAGLWTRSWVPTSDAYDLQHNSISILPTPSINIRSTSPATRRAPHSTSCKNPASPISPPNTCSKAGFGSMWHT